ncbi:hypothetical protein ACQP2U_07535 [Nocardia sp. CA-084685]|uniref:hypothetical protein n=1 Tax=Nocardia sp. CA-084685 TaxID=3239970 RepID=UPI003D98B49D
MDTAPPQITLTFNEAIQESSVTHSRHCGAGWTCPRICFSTNCTRKSRPQRTELLQPTHRVLPVPVHGRGR